MGRKERLLGYWRKFKGSALGNGYPKQKFVPEGNPHHALCKKIRREEEKAIEETLEKYGIPDRVYVDEGIPVQGTKEKKLMTMNDENEFIDQVIALAGKKSMTISNIIDAVEKVVAYMEDNATLVEGPPDNGGPSEYRLEGSRIVVPQKVTHKGIRVDGKEYWDSDLELRFLGREVNVVITPCEIFVEDMAGEIITTFVRIITN